MFLSNSQNLSKIDLTPLSQLTVISERFLEKCVSLTEIISLQPFNRVDAVGPYFLEGCTGLKNITIPLSASSTLMLENVYKAVPGANTEVMIKN